MGFRIYKGVDQEMEFKGLKAQYLLYMGLVLGGSLLAFSVLYTLGFPLIISLIVCVTSVLYLSKWIAGMNKKMGKDGLMKKQVNQRLPTAIRIRNRGFVKSLSQKKAQV